jgi:hypothetical protein
MNWETSKYGSGFWCMISAIAVSAVSPFCLASFSMLETQAHEFNEPPIARYQTYTDAYSPGLQYQHGTEILRKNRQQDYYPTVPPTAQQALSHAMSTSPNARQNQPGAVPSPAVLSPA